MKPKISLVTLGARDFERSLAFYRDGLGLPVHQEADGFAMFAMDGSYLSIFGWDALAADARVDGASGAFSGVTLARNVGSRDEVDTQFAEAIAAGAKAVKPPRDVFWGGYSGYFADPDGHLWEIAWNPGTDLT